MPGSQRVVQICLLLPSAVWLGYLVPELVLPVVMVAAQMATRRRLAPMAPVAT